MELNPYAPPQSPTLAPPLPALPDAEAVRREHIHTEATIKSVGTLYYLGAFLMILVGLSTQAASQDISAMTTMAIFVTLGAAQLVTGYGLRRLRGWARIPTLILSGIGLLAFPIGTLINAYIMVKVLGRQGRFVMTPEYQRIIAATPHVKRKTSIVVWILLVLLIVALIGFLVFAVISNR